jgi:hypothetical protein
MGCNYKTESHEAAEGFLCRIFNDWLRAGSTSGFVA